MNIDKIIEETNAHYCLECGICTGSCPLSRITHYSPRLMVERSLLLSEEELIEDKEVWTCLTCGACSARCPSLVDYNEFMRRVRDEARQVNNLGICTHAGTLQAVTHLQTADFVQRDTSWITNDLRTSEKGEYLYFVGCLPYFEVIFRDIHVQSLNTALSTIKILNALGIEPVVSSKERCCGHDLYWAGDFTNFENLAQRNLNMIKDSGAKKVIFSCPEGYATFKLVYPKFFGEQNFEVVHITELIANKIGDNGIVLKENPGKVTYQDPCRLGRFAGIYEEPRKIIQSIPGIEFQDMPRNRANALCCGSSTWINCTQVNKKIQLERLKEAEATGAETLITACPKCNIHLNCALHDNDFELSIKTKNLITLVAESL